MDKSKDRPVQSRDDSPIFPQEIGRKEKRRLHALKEGEKGASFWLGMFGLVGWSVAVPAVGLTLLGSWIDHRFPSSYSWTLMGLFGGMLLGMANAWYWIQKESSDHDHDNHHRPD